MKRFSGNAKQRRVKGRKHERLTEALNIITEGFMKVCADAQSTPDPFYEELKRMAHEADSTTAK